MLSLLFLVLVVLGVSLVVVAASSSTPAVTVCPKAGSIERGEHYHDDSQCDRAAYNQYKESLERYYTYQKYKAMGGIKTVPNEKTVTCPMGGRRVSMQEPHTPGVGMDTVFFLENKASTPVVVAFVNQDGIEVSAKNPHITPAVADPNAIIPPGNWMAMYAFEGHEFVVREVKMNGMAAGSVLLQHRAGLIPVGTNTLGLTCPTEDVEPLINQTIAPAFARTPSAINRPCNTMDIGFRNVANCPLHGYYVSGEGTSCTEQFKFHLGVESVTQDFQKDWISNSKFEGTFIGHTFHFRLASNPSVLVDTVTLAPIMITDCPVSSAEAEVRTSTDPLGIATTQADRHLAAPNSSAMPLDGVYQQFYSSLMTNSSSTGGATHRSI